MEHASAYTAERERLNRQIIELRRERDDVAALRRDILDMGENLAWGMGRMRQTVVEVSERWPADRTLSTHATEGCGGIEALMEQVNGLLSEGPDELDRQLRALEREEDECRAERAALEHRQQEDRERTAPSSWRNDACW